MRVDAADILLVCMTERDQPTRPEIPAWAAREREGDLGWIRENLDSFWPVAQQGYQAEGRGAIVVDTTSQPTGAGHPFGYLRQEAVEQSADEDTIRMVGEYDPDTEFVTVLFKAKDQVSSYRVRVILSGGEQSGEVDPYSVVSQMWTHRVEALLEAGEIKQPTEIDDEVEMQAHMDYLDEIYRDICRELSLPWPRRADDG